MNDMHVFHPRSPAMTNLGGNQTHDRRINQFQHNSPLYMWQVFYYTTATLCMFQYCQSPNITKPFRWWVLSPYYHPTPPQPPQVSCPDYLPSHPIPHQPPNPQWNIAKSSAQNHQKLLQFCRLPNSYYSLLVSLLFHLTNFWLRRNWIWNLWTPGELGWAGATWFVPPETSPGVVTVIIRAIPTICLIGRVDSVEEITFFLPVWCPNHTTGHLIV